MPLSDLASLSTLVQQARAMVRVRFPSRGVNDGQFLGKLARVFAMGLFGVQRRIEAIDRDSPPNSKSSHGGLVAWSFAFGVPSNAGGYGPNVSEPAGGGQGLVTGTPGTHVNAGLQLFAPDGVTLLELLDPGGGFGVIPFTGTFEAVTPGTVGDIEAGEQITWISPPPGCDPAVTLSVGLSGGLDSEADPALFDRLQTRMQKPPKGGANVDFKAWAEAVAGVYIAYVYPRRSGTGTVDVVVTVQGSGAGRQPGGALLTAVAEAIALVAPTNIETINVFAPNIDSSYDLQVRVKAVPTSKYSWDWVDTSGTWTVAGYNGAGPTLTLNTAAHSSLQAAIASGLQPRIQVVNTTGGAPVVPEQRRVIAIDVTNTILTLDSALSVNPTNGDAVYAGSYFARTAGLNALAYIDSLGPSRLSGLADTVNQWDDVMSNNTIGAAVRDTFDTDGTTRMVDRVVLNGVLVKVGAGGFSVQDFEPPDAGATPPAIARATRVWVTQ